MADIFDQLTSGAGNQPSSAPQQAAPQSKSQQQATDGDIFSRLASQQQTQQGPAAATNTKPSIHPDKSEGDGDQISAWNESIASKAWHFVRDSDLATTLFGPTERKISEEGVWTSQGQQYKPAGNRLEQEGVFGAGLQSPERIKELMFPSDKNDPGYVALAKAASNTAVGVVNVLSNPFNIATGSLGAIAKSASATPEIASLAQVAAGTIGKSFAIDMASHVPDSLKRAKQAYDNGDTQGAWESSLQAILGIVGAAHAAKDAIKFKKDLKNIPTPVLEKITQDKNLYNQMGVNAEVVKQEVAERSGLPETSRVLGEQAEAKSKDQPETNSERRVVSTAVVDGEGKVVAGENFNTTHDEISAAKPDAELTFKTQERTEFQSAQPEASKPENQTETQAKTEEPKPQVPEENKGFIIENPDGTQYFTNSRQEAYEAAKEGGQVREGAIEGELHSADLLHDGSPEAKKTAGQSKQQEPVESEKEQESPDRVKSEVPKENPILQAEEARKDEAIKPEPVGGPGAMGKVEAGEMEASRGVTATKNEVADNERVKRGLQPVVKQARKALGKAWENAEQELDRNENAGRELVSELNQKPRAATDNEEAILLMHKIQLQNKIAAELERASSDTYTTPDGKKVVYSTPQEREAARAEYEKAQAELDALDQATKAVGTEWGRAGRFRQQLANDDYTLATMLKKKKASVGDRKLTPEEEQAVKDQSEKIAELEKKYQESQKTRQGKKRTTKVNEAVEQAKADAAKEPTGDRDIEAETQSIADGIQRKAQKGTDFASMRTHLRRLVENLVRMGHDTTDTLTDAVHHVLNQIKPITKEQVQDLISGYGIHKPLTKDAVKLKVRDLAGQMLQLGKIRDLMNKVAPKKTGVERGKPSLAERTLVKLVNKLKKETGLTATDPESQLKGALDAVKTRLRNQIEDLADQIETGVKRPKDNNKVQYDAEALELKTRRDALQKQLDAMEDPNVSIAEQIEAAKKAVERDISEYDRRISEKDFSSKGKKSKATSPELESLRAKRDAKREEYEHLRDLDDHFREQRQLKEADREIARIEDELKRLESGEPKASKEKAVDEPASEAVAKRRAEKEAALERLKAKREELKPKMTFEEKQIKRLDKQIEKAQSDLESGNLTPENKRQITVELESILARRKRLQELKDQKESAQYENKLVAKLDARIAKLDEKLASGDLSKQSLQRMTVEREEVLKRRQAVKEREEALRGQQKKKTYNDKLAEALDKRIARLEGQIQSGDFSTQSKTKMTVEEEPILKRRQQLQDVLEKWKALRDSTKPVKTKEAIALQAWRTRVANQIADLQERAATKDFAPKERAKTELPFTSEDARLKVELERAKQNFQSELAKDKQARMGRFERTVLGLAKWHRTAVLSGVVTLGKLTTAAQEIIAFSSLENAISAAYGKILPAIGRGAGRRAEFSLSTEGKAVLGAWKNMFKDIKDELTTGKMDIDILYGKEHAAPRELKDFVAHVHGALKSTTRRNEFIKSFEYRTKAAEKQGIDVSDPGVQMRIAVESYQDAMRSIFRNENLATKFYKRGLSALTEVNKKTGERSTMAKTAEASIRYMMPVVEIPTNIVARTFEYSFGTATGTARIIKAAMQGFDKLDAQQKDLILQNLSRGSVGLATVLLGFFNPDNVGGYARPGDDKNKNKVKAGGVRLFGVDIPKWAVHNPLLEQLQIGATIRKVADKKLGGKAQGIPAGVMAGYLGLLKHVPFLGVAEQAGELMDARNPKAAVTRFAGQQAKSMIPLGIQQAAPLFDEDYDKRKPETVGQYLMKGIPGLSDEVPKKKNKFKY